MKWPWKRRKKPQPSTDGAEHKPDRMRIALLEHELLGITPEPGTPEAVTVTVARPVNQEKCPHENVIDTTGWGQARSTGLCERCGAHMVETDDGDWKRP